MSAERFSLNANVLIYAVDTHVPDRHDRAVEVVEEAALKHDCIVALQAYAEFFAAATRKGKVSVADARAQIADWQLLFTTVYPSPSSLLQAIDAATNHNIAFWDAMLWSVLKDSGATVLLSEDFQDGRELDGVLFRNPFATSTPFQSK
jgi:predicted nucleic acid-binding protein